RTGGIVARELEALGLEVTKGVGKTGVVGLLEGRRPGPTLLLRFDMDALPIVEETGADYASTVPGVMHACGHDGHTAIGLTVARILNGRKEELAGTVKFVFQPSEESTGDEGLGGAQMMIRDGVLAAPRPDYALGLHLWNEEPLGWLGVAAGPVMAGCEHFKIALTGKGGHGAVPHASVDPMVAASHVITALQTIVARNVAPLETAVVSVTSVHGGSAFNVIPERVMLEGTIRSFDLAVRARVLERFRDIVEGVSAALGCRAEIDMKQVTPPVINDDRVTRGVQEAARHILPESQLDTASFITMGAEDMAFFLERVPGCFFFVGSANREKGLDYGHHHPKFDVDEDAMPRAAALMAGAALELLK
ncbi:MAG: M20 metallopeptidase family protein, partial [Bacteroidota bacterium]